MNQVTPKYFTFSYDGERLIKVSNTYKYIYDEGWEESSATFDLVYELVSVTGQAVLNEMYEDATATYVSEFLRKYTYNESGLVEEIFSELKSGDSYDTEENTYKMEYGSDDMLSRQAQIDEEGINFWDIALEWDANNVTKETHWDKHSINDASRIFYPLLKKKRNPLLSMRKTEEEYSDFTYTEFDNKKNPFSVLLLIIPEVSGWLASSNNPGKSVIKYSSHDEIAEYIYEYENDLPTKVTITEEDGGDSYISIIEIQYR